MKTANIIKYSLIAGISIAIYLGLLSALGNLGASPLKFLKYVILGAVLFTVMSILRKSHRDTAFLTASLSANVKIAAIAGVIVVIANAILYSINPELSLEKYSMIPEEASDIVVVSGILIMESVVIGLLLTFVIYPALKNKYSGKEISETQVD